MNRVAAVALAAAILIMAPACATGGPKPARPGTQPRSAAAIELNTATAAQLQTLPGITVQYARRIIANRPYKVKHELETRKILPSSVYRRIRDRVIATER